MLECFKTVYRGGEAEIVEKKSRFIGTVRPVESEEEAFAFLEEMRKKYWDATHNCFAFVAGERREWVRAADDGEPSGTAGRAYAGCAAGGGPVQHGGGGDPLLRRYAAGGTGGLVRAYSRAVQEALKSCVILEKRHGVRLEIRGDYTDLGKIQYILGQRKIPLLGSEYTDRVLLEVILPKAEERDLLKALTEATGGKAVLEEKGGVLLWDYRRRSKAVLNLSRSPALHKSHPGCQRSWTE